MSSDNRKERIRQHLLDSANGRDFIPPSKMRKWPSRAANQSISPISQVSSPQSTQSKTEDTPKPEALALPTQELNSNPDESKPLSTANISPTEEEKRKQKVQDHLRKSSDCMEGYFVKDDGKRKEKIRSHLRQIFSQGR